MQWIITCPEHANQSEARILWIITDCRILCIITGPQATDQTQFRFTDQIWCPKCKVLLIWVCADKNYSQRQSLQTKAYLQRHSLWTKTYSQKPQFFRGSLDIFCRQKFIHRDSLCRQELIRREPNLLRGSQDSLHRQKLICRDSLCGQKLTHSGPIFLRGTIGSSLDLNRT